jgi:hypothetical protein
MKSIPYIMVSLLLLSSIAIVTVGEEAGEYQQIVSKEFFEPNVVEEEQFIRLEVEGTNSKLTNPGEPALPVYTETIALPFGTTIENIDCKVGEIVTMVLPKEIIPGPQRVRLDRVSIPTTIELEETIYNSEVLYPDDWYSYSMGAGLDDNMEHKTFLTITTHPVRYIGASDEIYYAESIDLTIEYNAPKSDPFPLTSTYDLVIIAPDKFSGILQGLVDHKESKGMATNLVTTEEIYNDFSGYDKPEQIKKFIRHALETWGIKYVLIVGGLNSVIIAEPREHKNYGIKDWHVPVRYVNIIYGGDEPGYIADLYFGDIYKSNGDFDDWDSNGNNIFGENADVLDCHPDVAVGRLPCRSKKEVKDIVGKIIEYETGICDPSWFKELLVVSGDGFLDMEALGFQWNTNGVSTGEYTIHAQAKNDIGTTGPIDELTVTVDKSQPTNINFNHDDHLITGLIYPHDPVAEIVSVSDGDVLGSDSYTYVPHDGEAYCNGFTFWGNVKYVNGILTINGKTYDPRPYGYTTDIHVWITDSGGSTVFDEWKYNYEMYFEGEWTTGNRLLHGRAGGPYYMPTDFNTEYLWSSNGKWTGQKDVIDAMTKGQGFVFFSGHGSPNVWANHYPGVPGNRHNGDVLGIRVLWLGLPVLPMKKIKNTNKNPVVVVGGCHNAMFNVSLIPTFLDRTNAKNMHTYGIPTPECWAWTLAKYPTTGAIATMGNTGYGYGILGAGCTSNGVDNWITTEIFVQYGEGKDILGETHSQAIESYIQNIGLGDLGDKKTVTQFVLIGDPSLQLGGYP